MQISCIIPTRDRSQLVCQAVASVRAQHGAEIEVVVVDDGSVDDTEALLGRMFPDLVYIRLPESRGPGHARNVGVAKATGDILMFLDSDDRWLSAHAQRLAGALKRGYAVAYGTTLTNDRLSGQHFCIPEEGSGVEGDCLAALCRWCFLVPSSLAVTRAAFQAVGGFPEGSLGEDWPFFIRLAQEYRFGFTGPRPITVRELHPGSLCAKKGREVLLAAVRQAGDALDRGGLGQTGAVRRFVDLEQWITHHFTAKDSVQECYSVLQDAGMI